MREFVQHQPRAQLRTEFVGAQNSNVATVQEDVAEQWRVPTETPGT
jgi:hypothetical protein